MIQAVFLKASFLGVGFSSSACSIKSMAKTGFIIYATISDANSVIIKVTGINTMNFPTTPGQKARGTKGARVVSVPESIGTKTSPAAYFADKGTGSLVC